jgi:hypothetical protein
MPKFTLPDSMSSEKYELEQMQTQRILPPQTQVPRFLLPQTQTSLIPLPQAQIPQKPASGNFVPSIYKIEAMITIDNPISIVDDEAFLIQTASTNAVKKVGAKERIGTFFANLVFLVLGILFLGAFAILIYEIPILSYKVTALTVFFVAFSYIASAYMKRIDRARHRRSLTVTQTMRAIRKEPAPKEDNDMDHLKLIKQDTTGYLRAIRKKDLKKEMRG